MYILYPVDFTLSYYELVKDLKSKFKALERLKTFKKQLKAREKVTAFINNTTASVELRF